MSDALFLEDFEVGQVLTEGGYTVSKEEAIGFASDYDPQYFHIDEEAAKAGPYGQLIVSGWHTAAITMRLKAQTILTKISGGLLGLGIDYIKWPRATFAGDTLRVVITILDKRVSTSKPTHGVMKYKVETFNQNGELAQEMVTAVWVPRRKSS